MIVAVCLICNFVATGHVGSCRSAPPRARVGSWLGGRGSVSRLRLQFNKVSAVSCSNESHAGRFSVRAAEHALRIACRSSGLDGTNAELIRLGENALFRLSSQPVVVRIARTVDYWDDVVKEVEVARWLAEQQIPAARLHDVPQPIRADEHSVTFWRYIAGRPGDGRDMAVLGAVLRRVHRTPRPTTFGLPRADIFRRVDGRIQSAPVPAADKDFLLGRVEKLRSEVSRLDYPLSPTVTHGDAHVKNLIMADGQPILIDSNNSRGASPNGIWRWWQPNIKPLGCGRLQSMASSSRRMGMTYRHGKMVLMYCERHMKSC
jgi:hypothetical protein